MFAIAAVVACKQNYLKLYLSTMTIAYMLPESLPTDSAALNALFSICLLYPYY
jgi:hypothetical protein